MTGRTGRRGADADTRGDILAAARHLFAAHGYNATSLRAVAREADVDPALVHHYFDGKSGLFAEAMTLPFNPAALLPSLLDGPRDELGMRLAELYVTVWDGPSRARLLGVLRSALTNEQAATMLREFMTATLVDGLAGGLDVDQPRLRASLCAAHVVGLGVLRTALRFEPLAAADDDEIVAWLAPTLQAYLTGPSPGT